MIMITVLNHIQGLIFDCDGTLVDSMPLHLQAWEYAIKDAGGIWDYNFIDSKKGMTGAEIVKAYNEAFHVKLDQPRVAKIKQDYFLEHYKDMKPIQPVVDIVRQYYKILPMAVASGGSKKNVLLELETIGLKDYFSVIITSDDDVKPKPSPEIFLETARQLDVPPHLCQVFEDGDAGVKAALNAGMHVTDIREFGI
jgi:HAD superfamily hydrolase (TIGR01509 family)